MEHNENRPQQTILKICPLTDQVTILSQEKNLLRTWKMYSPIFFPCIFVATLASGKPVVRSEKNGTGEEIEMSLFY